MLGGQGLGGAHPSVTVAMTVSCGLTTRHLHSGLPPNQGSNCSVDFLKLKFVSFCEDGGAAHRDRRCVLGFQGASRRTPSALLGQSRVARGAGWTLFRREARPPRISLQGARGGRRLARSLPGGLCPPLAGSLTAAVLRAAPPEALACVSVASGLQSWEVEAAVSRGEEIGAGRVQTVR